jgi:hypothetical protein
MRAPRRPILIDSVFEDVEPIRALFARHAPYELLQGRRQVMSSAVEQAAIVGTPITQALREVSSQHGSERRDLNPVFRGYWVLGEPVVEGVDWILEYPKLHAAARELHDAKIVRPNEIYAHLVCPEPRIAAGPHVDIPNFRGMGRRDYPTWLLVNMRRSGLFDRWHIPVATAVMWFYEGRGGEYEYWANGPEDPPSRTAPPFSNKAVVGENDTMFHQGQPPLCDEDGPELGMTSTLHTDDGSVWTIMDGDRPVSRHARSDIRFALSWSAQVFTDEDSARAADEHQDDLNLETVVSTFVADLERRGIDVDAPGDPLHDEDWVTAVANAYRIPVSG